MATLSKEEQKEALEELEYQEQMESSKEKHRRHEGSESVSQEAAEHRQRPRLSKREREIAHEELEYAYPEEPAPERKVRKDQRSEYLEELDYSFPEAPTPERKVRKETRGEYLEELDYLSEMEAREPVRLHKRGSILEIGVMPDYMEELDYSSRIHIGKSSGRVSRETRPDYMEELAYSYDIGASRREKAGGFLHDIGFTRADILDTGRGVRGLFSGVGSGIMRIPQMSSVDIIGGTINIRDAMYGNVRPAKGRKGRISSIGANVGFFRGAPSMMVMDPFRIGGFSGGKGGRRKGKRGKGMSRSVFEEGIPDSLSWMF